MSGKSLPTIILMVVLFGILAGAVYVSYVGWTSTDVAMPASGWIAMTLGIVFSLIVGCGLMGLMFYSSRRGFDDAAHDELERRRRR